MPMLTALLALTLALGSASGADHPVTVLVTDEHEGTPLPGATVIVEGTDPIIGATADASGLARLTGVASGEQTLVVSFVGFETQRVTVTVPLAPEAGPVEVALHEDEEALGDVVVAATRTSRTIANEPTRVETIAGEEIDEKVSMEPSNITMLLNESPGIMVQQTSAVSANASIRIQGLDGRYTQLLKDGFPLYGGFSGGLSLLQIPPLDLRQVEIIKGPASTLYGGDAIAGLVNLVTKTPEAAPTRSLLVNATSAGGLDAGAFLAARSERLGYTLLASANRQSPYDGDGDAFTNLPRSNRLTLAPRGYWYASGATTLWAGVTGTVETREGGDVDVIRDSAEGYTERSESYRLTSQMRLDHRLSSRAASGAVLTLKYSGSAFDRRIALPDHEFGGLQTTTYSEASGLFGWGAHDLVAGFDLRTDEFDQSGARGPSGTRLNYNHLVAGAFVQDTWDVNEHVAVELGLRGDWHDAFGVFVLPRASALLRVSPEVSLRATGGLGYKAPTVFLEPSEARAFRGVLPLDDTIEAETSAGGTVDVNVQTVLFDRISVSLNQAAYVTRLDDALVPGPPDTSGLLRYFNAGGSVLTRGLETNLRLGLDDFKLFLGYVYLDATQSIGGLSREALPLTPAHKTYSVLVWEQHGRQRIGLEAYYTGPQTLPDGEQTEGYLVTGIMAERRFGPARLFLNLENLLDTQQTNYGPVVLGPRATPTFADIWAPTDGFIVNGGVKLDL